jgi:hypothetical protein|tara:strand:+ start:258 stop:521 length:264 start_codon:yes stop_codon:yes gene_type:complete
MAINFAGEKIKEPEDNIKYSEKKFQRQRNNGLTEELDKLKMAKLNRKEKNDLELLKLKEENSETFGPLTDKEQIRLNDLLIKEKKED